MVRNDHLALLQEMVGHRHAFIQQAAGIAAQIEHQARGYCSRPSFFRASSSSWLVFSLNCSMI